MSTPLQRITPWLAGAAVALSLSACGTPSDEQPSTPDPVAPSTSTESLPPEALDPDSSVVPVDPAEDPGDQQTFDGDSVTTDVITANNMDIEIPSGLRIPEDTLVTEAKPASIMMAEEDPAAVVAMVESSAEEAGYEVHAEVDGGKVYVGNGNAVLFTAGPMVQILTWGPEEMKDILADF